MSGRNILVIDDSNTNLVLLEALLVRKGYEVDSAPGATEGIASMKRKVPDLIYLDLIMPEIDGFEFIRLIRENSEWNKIPIVVLSAITDMETIKRSKDLGVTEYITKPLNIHKLVDLTNSILGEMDTGIN